MNLCTRCSADAIAKLGHHGPEGLGDHQVEWVCEWHRDRMAEWHRCYHAGGSVTDAILQVLAGRELTSRQVCDDLADRGRVVTIGTVSARLARMWVQERVDRQPLVQPRRSVWLYRGVKADESDVCS